MVRTGGRLRQMTATEVLVWLWKNVVPRVWSPLLTVPRGRWSRMGGAERDAFANRVSRWLIAWRYSTLGALTLAMTVSPPGTGECNSGPIRYSVIGLVFTASTFLLYCFCSLRDYLAPWRTAVGGTCFILAPFLLPGIAFKKPFALLRHLMIVRLDPWFGDGFRVNGSVCVMFVALNFLVCLSFWWFARKRVQ